MRALGDGRVLGSTWYGMQRDRSGLRPGKSQKHAICNQQTRIVAINDDVYDQPALAAVA